MLLSNTSARVDGVLTSLGSITVVNSRVTYTAPVTISGSYISDPSTNIFKTNVVVTDSGFLQGGTGDLFQFERNLTLQPTNAGQYNVAWRASCSPTGRVRRTPSS